MQCYMREIGYIVKFCYSPRYSPCSGSVWRPFAHKWGRVLIPQATLLGEQLILKLVAYFESGTKNFFSEFVEWLNKLEPPTVNASPRTLPRPFLLADILQRRLAAPYHCSRYAILTICTRLPAQGWRSTPMKSITNKRSCCWAPQGRPPPEFRRPVLQGAASTAGGRTLAGRARRGLHLGR